MARIRKLAQLTQSIRPHKTEVDCYHQALAGDDGEVLLHLSTFGSDARKSQPKVSQTLQIDARIAAELIDVICETFPHLRSAAE